MSVFFSVMNNATSLIDDSKISADTTYSSYKIQLLVQELLAQMFTFDYKEYPANVRNSSQKTFITPNSKDGLLLVLREGVKMALGDDFVKDDDFRISFVADVPEDLNVFILVLRIGSQGPGNFGSPDEFIFTQDIEALVWEVPHGLGNQYPTVTVVDGNNSLIEPASIQYTDFNKLIVTLNTSTKGKCICRL
jgi:hypothetical protein